MDLQDIGYVGVDWIELAHDRQVAGTYDCGNETSDYIKCGELLD